ncbi:phosphoribosylformylglycinamidine synthase [Tistlia consotensis]|uniref:Phosphoribosylformylglycinamidine synthase subunit PurQ n=1 Tax=Tistlia consotensis USBA 355 TaxID=560819 RepID=A0A1Y6C1M6_9PROT|nr:phosphoribosylformylglycinamidine synthase subunit PurQ [Tistlia consotensis]SMF40802.1 phosphoribosylformylglycinamidine synthase subunit I [Tistlia consotensis USBA 355]SNR74421.1 phosphoribosylformylglycinamidine synthase [Tistlia consotensis]
MRSAVIVFPGSNREMDMVAALEQASGKKPALVFHKDTELPEVDLIVLPGGFSHGDYLRAGAMAARSPVMAEVRRRAEKGVPVLGVCNGFQILTEAGLLPGALMRNASLRFVCKNVTLRCENAQTLFTGAMEAGQRMTVPCAHMDGNYFADADTMKRLEDSGGIAFRYVDGEGRTTEEANPNGSLDNVAGVFNETKTVLGLMPHPEDATDPLHGGTDGRALFHGLAEALA